MNPNVVADPRLYTFLCTSFFHHKLESRARRIYDIIRLPVRILACRR